jgi:hypothetical protein
VPSPKASSLRLHRREYIANPACEGTKFTLKKYLDFGFSGPIELNIPCNEQAITMHWREGLERNRSLHPLHKFVYARMTSHRFSPGH